MLFHNFYKYTFIFLNIVFCFVNPLYCIAKIVCLTFQQQTVAFFKGYIDFVRTFLQMVIINSNCFHIWNWHEKTNKQKFVQKVLVIKLFIFITYSNPNIEVKIPNVMYIIKCNFVYLPHLTTKLR